MECSVELSMSVDGIIFACIKCRSKSKIARFSCWVRSQFVTISLQDMFALDAVERLWSKSEVMQCFDRVLVHSHACALLYKDSSVETYVHLQQFKSFLFKHTSLICTKDNSPIIARILEQFKAVHFRFNIFQTFGKSLHYICLRNLFQSMVKVQA